MNHPADIDTDADHPDQAESSEAGDYVHDTLSDDQTSDAAQDDDSYSEGTQSDDYPRSDDGSIDDRHPYDPPRAPSPRKAEDDTDLVAALRTALSNHALPCSTGSFPVTNNDLILYYGKEGPGQQSSRIDFSQVSDDEISRLVQVCDAATFGRNNEDVLDESYRKASKLDTEYFLLGFEPVRSRLIDTIGCALLEGQPQNRRIRFERYKLNVYGPGSFFKAHKDTPRSQDMFGTLVIVLPTTHSGGSLTFRHGDLNFEFDSAKAVSLSIPSSPCIAFAAFYSDVEHTVTPVLSGYRVTVTYNLYFEDVPTIAPSVIPFTSAYETALTAAFRNLLGDPDFMNEGGLLGFGLKHEYPLKVKRDWSRRFSSLRYLADYLKGGDAVLMKVCESLNIPTSFRMVYYENDGDVSRDGQAILCPGVFFQHGIWENSNFDHLTDAGGKFVRPFRTDAEEFHDYEVTEVAWAVAPLPAGIKEIKRAYIANRNEPTLSYLYSSMCLIVKVPGVRKRSRKAFLPENY